MAIKKEILEVCKPGSKSCLSRKQISKFWAYILATGKENE